MRPVGATLELRMVLNAHIEGPVGQFYRFHKSAVRGKTAQCQAGCAKDIPVIIVELITVTVALVDHRIAIAPCHGRSIGDHAGIASQPQRSALVDLIALAGHEINDLMSSLWGKFTRVCICDTQYMTGVFDHGDLHSEADTKIRDVVFPRILCRQNHAFDTAVTEAAGDNDTVQIGKDMIFRFLCDGLGVDPLNVDHGVKRKTCMAQSLGYGEIGVVELYILAHKSNGDSFAAALDGIDHAAKW